MLSIDVYAKCLYDDITNYGNTIWDINKDNKWHEDVVPPFF